MQTVQHKISDTEIADIKRLIAEATVDESGVMMPVIRDDNWGEWIGAAKAHFIRLIRSVEGTR